MANIDDSQVEKMNEPIVRRVHHPWITRFFFYMSKTDMHVLQFCTPETRLTQASMGIMVVITGALAFISSFFAIHSSFFAKGESFPDIFIPVLVATFYAIAIVFFDREIVAATSKWAAVPRAVLAIFIGIVIAFPIEMKLLEGSIEAQIVETYKAEHKDKYEEIVALKKEIDDGSKEIKKDVLAPERRNIESLIKLVESKQDTYDKERLNVKCAAKCDKRAAELKAVRKELNKARSDMKEAITTLDEDMTKHFAKKVSRIETIREEIKEDIGELHDFLSQAKALHKLVNTSETAKYVSLFLTIFFIVLEIFPVLIKVFLPYSEYNAYLDARRKLNISRTFAIANYNLEKIENDPAHAHEVEVEITDVIEKVMEDRLVDVEHGRPV